ncbi:hypothetical protein [Enterocloster clostridioformis]|uniref:hypothetical protein n=1 Tax=Enterocloster clostridioformis TaxID=1531 RepID=UPI000403FF84|nr:hypothetical protein [Enterocloster clostridioformis]
MHRAYDTENFGRFIAYLEQRFTKEQIESAFQILQAYSDYIPEHHFHGTTPW